ncbi:uncharacterized protein LOC114519938 [Dendronephthya gigantea]|uniref:uncharacterized protein LOC114519938 n=1 Tax=Dendronephthya gigantea TaxID=151771 RepID=UPI00106B045E|nr:uncharacterized protein LOC114519938 [Dendronephthya gigantea]
MYIHSASKKLSRLCLRSFQILPQSSRNLHGSDFEYKKFRSIKGKSESSSRWLRRQAKDPFVHKAAKDGYRCRSAYKLLEMDDKFNFLTPGSRVVDCGASPGSWTQVALERIKSNRSNERSGMVVAVDLLDIKEIPGCITLGSSDFTCNDVQQRIIQYLPEGQADVVMSDMAPASTGHGKLDHYKIVDLNRSVLEFAKTILSEDGCLICKLWDGNETADIFEEISDCFSFCKKMKPRASRMDSSEFYIFSRGFLKKR